MMVRVVWTDSGLYREDGWETKEEILANTKGLVDVVTVGTLVHEDDEKYYVALSSDNVNEAYYGVQIIGKFAVREFGTLMVHEGIRSVLPAFERMSIDDAY